MSQENGIHVITDTSAAQTCTSAANEQPKAEASTPSTVKVTLELAIDLHLLRKQKRALIGIREGTAATSEQEEAAEGMLNLADFIQDSILEQGLATEEEVFPRLPQLFDPEPPSQTAAA